MKSVIAFLFSALVASSFAFAPVHQGATQYKLGNLHSAKNSFDPLNIGDSNTVESVSKFAVTSAAVFAFHPIVALAEEVADDYEYGAVNAPVGLAWGAGVLAILTALLPIALQGGEEAFEEMRQQDEDNWGTGNSKRLNSRK